MQVPGQRPPCLLTRPRPKPALLLCHCSRASLGPSALCLGLRSRWVSFSVSTHSTPLKLFTRSSEFVSPWLCNPFSSGPIFFVPESPSLHFSPLLVVFTHPPCAHLSLHWSPSHLTPGAAVLPGTRGRMSESGASLPPFLPLPLGRAGGHLWENPCGRDTGTQDLGSKELGVCCRRHQHQAPSQGKAKVGGGEGPLFLLLSEILETDSLDWKMERSALIRAGGQGHQTGTSLANCCCGLQLGWFLQITSWKAKGGRREAAAGRQA